MLPRSFLRAPINCAGSAWRGPLLFPFMALAGCAASERPAAVPLATASVGESASLPADYEERGALRAECHGKAWGRALENERLADVDCTFSRLTRELRARAAERGADLVVGRRCRSRGEGGTRLACDAVAAWPRDAAVREQAKSLERPAPSAPQVLELDEPMPLATAEIRVNFRLRPGVEALAPRGYERVAELSTLPVQSAPFADASARCDVCDDSALRHALRVTAGRFGAYELTSVSCFAEQGARRCVGLAARPWSF